MEKEHAYIHPIVGGPSYMEDYVGMEGPILSINGEYWKVVEEYNHKGKPAWKVVWPQTELRAKAQWAGEKPLERSVEGDWTKLGCYGIWLEDG
jgi:hypothetical protein